MALSKEFTKEQLNYFRICYATTDILTEGLREIFKQEWDKQHKLTKGEWKDEPQNGMDFYNGESARNQRRNAHLLTTMQNGNREEWDCTMLFYAILFSDCVGPSLSATVRMNVDHLRNFRNEEFAHMKQGSLSDTDFQNAISKVEVAFQVLGLHTVKIQDLKNQKTFPTEELQQILKKVDDLKQEVQEKEDQRQVLEDQLHKETPSFCILPPKPSHDIGGREREVSEIAQQLRELKESSDNKLSCLYISGNPGSGKSQLAGLVAKRYFDEIKEIPGKSLFVMTLNAAGSDSLLESYVSFARLLRCPDYSVMEILSSKDWKVEEKITYLKMLIAVKISCYTSWLLVVDNVSTMSSVHVHLPQAGIHTWARGQMLITTQDIRSIPPKGSFVNHISASKGMEPDDACSLLAKLSGIKDSELLRKVAQKLDYQPLALAGAAVFVKGMRQDKASKHFGWNEYLKMLEKGKRETTEDTLAYTNPIYPKSMTQAIKLAVETLMTSDEIVKHLFTLLSLCAPQQLNVDVAINYIINVLQDFHEEDKELIRMKLRNCSLLLFEDDQGGYFIRVHQIVHDVIKIIISNCHESQTPQVVNAVITSFDEFIDAVPQLNRRPDTMHLVPHLKAITMVTDELFVKENFLEVQDKDISEKCENLAHICEIHCEFKVAKKYIVHSLTIKLENLGPEHVDVARSYNILSLIYKDLGDLEQAKKYQERTLAITLDKLGPEHVHVATSYQNLSIIYQDLGHLDKAKEYRQRALAIKLNKLGPEHLDVAISCNNLFSITYQDQGNLEQAREYQQRVLSIILDNLGPKHVHVARSYNNLSFIYRDLGDPEQAREYQQRALVITLDKLGPEHVHVATCYDNLALICRDLGNLEQAREYQQRALAIRLDKHGPEHVHVATSYNNLASVYLDLGNLEQAKEYQQRALTILLDKLDPENVHVATSYHNLSPIYQNLGDLEQAKEYQERALAIRLDKLGPKHVHVATSYNNLASIYQDLGKLEQAKEYQKRAVAILLDKLGPEHVDVATSYHNLSSVYKNLGDLEQAKVYQQRALEIALDKLGPKHVHVGKHFSNLAAIYKSLGDLKQAKEYEQRALAITQDKLGPGHVDIAKRYNNLALIYLDLRDLQKAKECQELALAIQLDKLGPGHVDVATSYNNLALICKSLGDLERAKEYQKRSLALTLDKLGPGHVYVGRNYNNLALIYLDLGDLQKAKECQELALALTLDKLGPGHVYVKGVYNNLVTIYRDLGDLEQARQFQQLALAIQLDKVGPGHVDVATKYNFLSLI